MRNEQTALERNVARYPCYVFCRDCLFWMPVFFLYFASILDLTRALQLEAVYYICVVLFEVPSGYLSDRWGRRRTLILSVGCLGLAYVAFFCGGTFLHFMIGQVLLALGFAAVSGTDTALHYESLAALDRADEYQKREAEAMRASFLAGAAAAVLGGIFAAFALRWAYAATLGTCLLSGFLAFSFVEPKREGSDRPAPFMQQVGAMFRKSLSARLRFFTLFTVGMTVLIHIPYEFYQPYVKEAIPALHAGGPAVPIVLGLHLAITMIVGARMARMAGTIEHRCRVRLALLACVGLQIVLIGCMAAFVHPIMAVLLIGRTAAKGLATPLVNAELGPLLSNSERSTYLSLQSLMGRLAHGLVLFVLPLLPAVQAQSLTASLGWCTLLGFGCLLLLWRTPFPHEEGHVCCGGHGHSHGHRSAEQPSG